MPLRSNLCLNVIALLEDLQAYSFCGSKISQEKPCYQTATVVPMIWQQHVSQTEN